MDSIRPTLSPSESPAVLWNSPTDLHQPAQVGNISAFCFDKNISDQRHDENILVDFVPPVSPGILPWRRDREGYWTDPILTIENNILQTLLRWIMRLRVIKISLISSVILVCTYGEQT